MTLALIYWVIYLILLISGGLIVYSPAVGPNASRWSVGLNLLWVILFGLIGWKLFGSPVKGG